MTRKIRRDPRFEVVLTVHDDGFIAPPRASQRNWLLNRALAEFAADLVHLDRVADGFVPGAEPLRLEDRTTRPLDDAEIMEDWQVPVMRAMSALVTPGHGDVLEVGYGRGMAAAFIQEHGVASHTIIECNASVVARFTRWRATLPERDIRMVEGRWQDVIDGLGDYDGVFFHTYPLTEDDFVEQVVHGATFAEHFFATAAAHLRPGGAFTYLTNEIDSLSRGHQRALFRHFSSYAMQLLNLQVPPDTRDAFWGQSMVLVKAVK